MKRHTANYADGQIYLIKNSINDCCYVGSTVNLKKRKAVHLNQAKKGQAPLYQAMRSLGPAFFTFHVLKHFSCENRKQLEAEEYRCLAEIIVAGTPVYNQRKTAGDKKSDATKRAMSAAKLGKATKSGCLGKAKQGYVFQWREQGKLQSRWFGWKKSTPNEAKLAAYAFRKSVHPAWQVPAEEETCDQLLLLEY